MNILKPNLPWRETLTPVDKANYDGIALHHIEEETATVEEVAQWHYDRYDIVKGKKVYWKGFGYGWYIRKDGTIYEGRGFNLNAAVDRHNGHVVSIAFEGDYLSIDKSMPDAQFNAGIDLIAWVKNQIQNIKTIDGHKRWNATECPGTFFPLSEMLIGKIRQPKVEVMKKLDDYKINAVKDSFTQGLIKDCEQWMRKADEPAPVWFVLVVVLNAMKILLSAIADIKKK